MESTTQHVTTRGEHTSDDETDSFFDIETHQAALLPKTSALAVVSKGNATISGIEAAAAAMVSLGALPPTSSLMPAPALVKLAAPLTTSSISINTRLKP